MPYRAAIAATANLTLPTDAGTYLLRGRASQSGIDIASASSFIKVAPAATRTPVRVLVLGSPEWANPVAEYLAGLGAHVMCIVAENTVIRPLRFPMTAGELQANYDVIWLAGFDAYWREAPDTLAPIILSAVRSGITLVHSGSFGSFHGGGDINSRTAGLDLTPLAELLPVEINHENDVYRASTFLVGKQVNPILPPHRFAVSATAAAPAWLQKLELTGLAPENFHLLRPKPQSAVLLRLDDLPLLVTGRFGKGRTIAYLGFSPEGTTATDHKPVILDRAIRESAAGRTFAGMSAIILALCSGKDPPTDPVSLIDERAVPLFEPLLTAAASPPIRVTATWSAGTPGSVTGHILVENGDRFNYGLRIRLAGANERTDNTLALWDNQFFDLLPHEIAETDVTVMRANSGVADRLWVAVTPGGGQEIRYTQLEVPTGVQPPP